MAKVPSRDELYRRLRRARDASHAFGADSRRLMQESAAACWRALQLQVDSIELRETAVLTRTEVQISRFLVGGLVDGAEAEATFENGLLTCPDEVLRRAEMVVAMGETFSDPDAETVEATLDGPAGAVLLTVMRAFSRVLVLEVGTEPDGDVIPPTGPTAIG